MDNNLRYHAQIVSDLSKAVTLHDGQKLVAKSIFIDGKTRVFVQCGRKWGKTSVIPYCSYRTAICKPGSSIFIIAPFYNQAKELLWADRRITHFFPDDIAKKYGIELNNSELRVKFGNGSYIKLLGADNPEAGRGVNPDMIIFDEAKDISSTYFESFEPNLAAKNGVLLMVGTPPNGDQNLFCKMSKEIKNDTKNGAFYTFPSWQNPYVDKEWFKIQKQRLIDRGEYDVFQREYEAKLVFGGHKSVFPMFNRKKHILKYEEVIAEIRKHPKDWDYYYSYDPGSKSIFAGLAGVIHKTTKKFIAVDEIYEKSSMRTSTGFVYPMSKIQMDTIQGYEDKWNLVYDNAAAWFANEVMFQFDRNMVPCEKDVKTKQDKESMIKDMMNLDLFYITDKCVNYASEIENYIIDEKGKTDKCVDHLLDCGRYLLAAANYDLVPDMSVKESNEDKRFYTMEEERHTNTGAIEDMVDWLYE